MITDCGTAKLMAAIFGADPDEVKNRMGVPSAIKPCPVCGKPNRTKHLCCSKECSHNYYWIDVECSGCGKLFKRRRCEVLYASNRLQSNNKVKERLFCGRKCLGEYLGNHYGFTAHPENTIYGGMKRKHNWEVVWEKHIETGYGAWRLSRLLNIPVPSITAILAKMKSREVNNGY